MDRDDPHIFDFPPNYIFRTPRGNPMRLPLHTHSLILESEPADGYAHFRITGEYHNQDIEKMIPAMLTELVRLDLDRALIDISMMTGELPDLDRYTLAEVFVRHWGSHRRAGIRVDSTKQRINGLFETVVLNRYGQVQVGDHTETLIAWILAE
jgi:hypothetical protein